MEKQHSTWYQVETDIALRKLSCPCGKDFIVHVTKSPLCPTCEKEVELPAKLTQEQMDLFLDEITDYLSYMEEDVDVVTEIDAEKEMEESLAQYEWWCGDRCQIQYIWTQLRESPSWERVLKYLESAYKVAYHRDDYCY